MDNFKKKETGAESTDTSEDKTKSGHIPDMVVNRGDNMLEGATKSVQSTVEEPIDTPVEDLIPPSTISAVSDSETWSKDSALKEVKKLRQENKKYREKYEEKLAKLSEEAESRIQAKERELETAAEKANKLDMLEQQAEDKKRSLEEKVAHREVRITELQESLNAIQNDRGGRLSQLEQELASYKVEQETRAAIAKETLQEELSTIPDKFKAQAEIFVKGAGTPSDALTALREAKLSGLFEEKSVYVNNTVPTAQTGARTSKEQLDQVEKDRKANMSSDAKIKEGLKQAFSKDGNSAVRLR